MLDEYLQDALNIPIFTFPLFADPSTLCNLWAVLTRTASTYCEMLSWDILCQGALSLCFSWLSFSKGVQLPCCRDTEASWRRHVVGHCGLCTQPSFHRPAMLLTHLGSINLASGVWSPNHHPGCSHFQNLSCLGQPLLNDLLTETLGDSRIALPGGITQ